VVRPPLRWEGGQLDSARPTIVNAAAVRWGSGVVCLALRGHFVGVVAETAAAARRAAAQLEIDWRFDTVRPSAPAVPPAAIGSSGAMASPDRDALQPTHDGGARRGAADAALDRASMRVTHSYGWPTGNLGSPAGKLGWPIGHRDSPSGGAQCRGVAIADVRPDAATIWTSAPATELRADLAMLLDLPPERITLILQPPGEAGADGEAADQSAPHPAANDATDRSGLHPAANDATDQSAQYHADANGATHQSALHHAAADAALMSQIAGWPVQVELSAVELSIEGGVAGRIVNRIDGGVDARGVMNVYRVATQYPALLATPLALLLTGAAPARRNAAAPADPAGSLLPPYDFEHLDLTVSSNPGATAEFDFPDCAAAQVFAYESHVDETAAAVGSDPVRWRLRHLRDARGTALIQRTVERAQWLAQRPPVQAATAVGGVYHGRGFAYARTVDCRVGAAQRSWSAWVADVEVDTLTGDVAVTRVVVGHDAGGISGDGGVIGHDAGERLPLGDDRDPALRITSPPLRERAHVAIAHLMTERGFDSSWPTPRGVGGAHGGRGVTSAPPPTAAIEVLGAVGAEPVPLAVGPGAMLPAAAAIANAIYAATGVRLREPPFSPERVRRALDDLRAPRGGRLRAWAKPDGPAHGAAAPIGAAPTEAAPRAGRLGTWAAPDGPAPGAAAPIGAAGRARRPRRWGAPIAAARHWIVGAVTGLAGALVLSSPWRGSIAPVAPPDPGYFSAAAVERGRLLSAAGDCAVCHTAPQGAPNAGGLELATPFGTIISSNITPDVDTGIGRWSYAAFERALRSGIHRDGRHLYPAFPYTAYAKLTDGDLLALYAYLMSQTPVRAATTPTRLAFPLNWRPLMAAWNLMFHRPGVFTPQPVRSLEWNRGAYLVDALGHCGACHSPRNVFGAERRGSLYLAGGLVDGWEAPALNASSRAPLGWSRNDFYDYLRSGYSANHGAAAGPMSAVVTELAALPDADLRAIATYLASLNPAPRTAAAALTPEASAGISTAALNPARRPAAAVNAVTADAAASRGTAAAALDGLGARIYGGACAVCHEQGQGPPAYGVKIALAPATALHAAKPTNLIRVLLDGIPNPPYAELGYMPAFHDTLDDRQLAQLADYLRARFAPGEPPWENVVATVAALRAASGRP
jgi:nicotinate dehydrogenase subunit B